MFPSRYGTPAARTPGGALSRMKSKRGGESEAVAVFCRVRPPGGGGGSSDSSSVSSGDDRCVEVVDNNTLRLTPPANSRNFYTGRAQQYTFKVRLRMSFPWP